ncbi:retroviral-like aspartic protease family protein [Sphingomonas donggukensis]|uniref:Retroviral-like aspartic protease family protein n=1 Tax=Sphingomonas donggukensis TaxID=2949093 RepID=A0ABY4TXE1_9SPHN|nr:retropepsin-like aspartic protease [Sphingomonas donggukensis]URW75814.1 retroviral-like aspartic protease family protein [Sphingomonas donggukensis]
MMSGVYPSLLALALMIPGAAAVPQDAPPAPPAPPADEASVAMTEVAERMTVPVRIADAGPYRFVIDTGSERTVISRQLAHRLGLPAGRDVTVVAMSGSTREATVMIPSLRLSSVPSIGVIQAPALDAGHLGGMGLLGIDTLQAHRITIDFDTGTMAVAPSVKRRQTEPNRGDEVVVRAKSLFGQLIVTDADVDGRAVRVVLDTGSPISVGNVALQKLMRRYTSRFEPLTMTSATGGIVQTQYAHAGRLRVGGIAFQDMPIAFADVPPFHRFGLEKRPAMLLGMNALKMFRRVQIDFPNREVRFLLPRNVDRSRACQTSINGACMG